MHVLYTEALMFESLILSMFLHHFALPQSVNEPDEISRYARGQVTVSVLDDTTLRGSVPRGAMRVPVLNLRLRASCASNVFVHSIEVQRRGLGNIQDIAAVYAVSGDRRLTRARKITNRKGTTQLRFRSFSIPACEYRDVSVLVDFSPDAAISGEHRFILTRASAIDAGSASVLVERMRGRSLRRAVRRTVSRTQGSISVDYLQLNNSIRYGSNRTVARFRLGADGRDDHRIYAITLTNQGTADDQDLQELFLEAGGRRVSDIKASMSGDQVKLVFSPPLELRKSSDRLFSLKADVRSGVRRTISFIIEEPSDIESLVARGRVSR